MLLWQAKVKLTELWVFADEPLKQKNLYFYQIHPDYENSRTIFTGDAVPDFE
jgi:hypothetical protein